MDPGFDTRMNFSKAHGGSFSSTIAATRGGGSCSAKQVVSNFCSSHLAARKKGALLSFLKDARLTRVGDTPKDNPKHNTARNGTAGVWLGHAGARGGPGPPPAPQSLQRTRHGPGGTRRTRSLQVGLCIQRERWHLTEAGPEESGAAESGASPVPSTPRPSPHAP